MPAQIVPEADVATSAHISDGSKIWHYAQVRDDASLGENCVVGRGAYVGTGVKIGNNCKIQNYALVYEPATLADGVFIGPAVVLTNDQYPRAVNPDGSLKSASEWAAVGVTVGEGAAIGARAVCVAPVRIGRWSLIAAGATVIHDVPDFAAVAGVPARRIAWVGRAGKPLEETDEGAWICPETGSRYVQDGERLREVEG